VTWVNPEDRPTKFKKGRTVLGRTRDLEREDADGGGHGAAIDPARPRDMLPLA
jgi:hypothetical protein